MISVARAGVGRSRFAENAAGGQGAAAGSRAVVRATRADHPGIVFKDGPTGRRATVAFGPDVWEVIKFLQEIDERGPEALNAAAEVFAIEASRVAAAVNYYGEYRDEIDAEIDAANKASERAEQAWRVQQRLIA